MRSCSFIVTSLTLAQVWHQDALGGVQIQRLSFRRVFLAKSTALFLASPWQGTACPLS
ncbi:MAG TPA: hypothetical protein V6C90_25765 [Coleofasciculaceae cyanobacterium]